MEDNAFPPWLKNLINSINAEGRLQSWELQTTLEKYSLTLEWIRPASCKGTRDHKFKPMNTVSRAENWAQTSDQTTLLETDHDYDMEADTQRKNGKTVKSYDFPRNCVQSPRADNIIEEGNELNAVSESETPEAVMNENEVEYNTQVYRLEKRQPEPWTKTLVSSFKKKTQFNFSPRKNGGQTADFSGQVANDNRVTEAQSVPSSMQDDHKKQAICSCGEAFISRSLSLSHLLSTCPISLCFRVELECNIQRVIDSWHGDQKVIGKAWWQSYKDKGFPDAVLELKDEKAKQLEVIVNKFIESAFTRPLRDHNGNEFVLITGLNYLDD